uniref:Uncharacterized protein n=1 Tax=Arundo donax TaxID=35708 RepID=A0A0A9AHK9_ARUDO
MLMFTLHTMHQLYMIIYLNYILH